MRAQRCLVLAGSVGDERRPSRPGDDPAWFEPLHVRAPASARERLVGALTAGADVILAPVWQAHPWAAARVGEARRSRDWTLAAVRLAREAAQEYERPSLVGGPIPRLAGLDDGATGRRPTAEASLADALRKLCGTLVDGGVDLLLVEDQDGLEGWRAALEAAAETGLPIWAELPGPDGSAAPWLETAAEAGIEGLLVPLGVADEAEFDAALAAITSGTSRGVGALLRVDQGDDDGLLTEAARRVAMAGAMTVGILDAADPARIARLRVGVDSATEERTTAAAARDAPWRQAIAAAARRAPGGRGLWLSDDLPRVLPEGFRWTVAAPAELPGLPQDAYSLVVAAEWDDRLERLLDDRGVLVCHGPGATSPGRLSVVEVIDAPAGPMIIARRE